MTILVQGGMALAVVGFFVAAWFRFSRPVRVLGGKPRQAPQISAGPSEAAPVGTNVNRRSPSL